jgi:transposase
VRRRERRRPEVLPKRRIVELTFAWLRRGRRLAEDHEGRAQTTGPLIEAAVIGPVLRRLAPP